MQEPRRLPHLRGRVQQPVQEEFVEQIQPPIQQTFSSSNQRPQFSNQQYEEPQQEAIQNNQSNRPVQPPIQSQNSQQQPLNSQKGGQSANQNMASREVQKKVPRIDTDQIPRPLIRCEDTVNYPIFKTTPTPLYHPPMSHQCFTVEDEGNASPRYIRSSIYALGNESSITTQTELPIGVIVQPLAEPGPYEQPIPLIEFPGEPIRCGRCKAYVNPFVQFVDNGNAFICNLCGFNNRTPNDYYAPLGVGNLRGDKYERPELCKGAYEIIAPSEYIKKPLDNILLMFCIELTQQTVMMGVYLQILASIEGIIEQVQCPERTDIAIVTFDQRMNFYNIPQNLASEPQIIIVSELEEVNIPLPKEKLFLNIVNDREKIFYLIEKLQKQAEVVQSKSNAGVPIGAMINNAANLMAPRSGRILVFTHTFPTIGLGRLTQKRVDTKIFGSDNEKTLYVPQDQAYVNIGKFCLQNHISVDLFVFNEAQYDLVSIAPVSNITGGTIYHYPFYDPIINGGELHYALFRNLTRAYAYDSIMTLRLSNGLTLFDYCTGQGKLAVRDLDISSLDSDKSIAIYFKHEDKIQTNEAYLQYAILYTNVYGQRLIRVFNLQFSVSNKSSGNNPWHNIFKTSDLDAVLGLILRKHLGTITTIATKTVRASIFSDLGNILYSYRKYCSSTSPHGQLILPETIKTLPLFIQAIFKRDALRQGQVRLDSRIYEIHLMMTQTFYFIHNYLYPKLYPIHNLDEFVVLEQYQFGQLVEEAKVVLPNNIPCQLEKIKSEGIYLLDTGSFIYLYVMRGASEQTLYDLFQVDTIENVINLESMAFSPDSDINTRVRNIIDQLRRNKSGAYQPIKVIVQKQTNIYILSTQLQGYFQTWLVEDEQRQEKTYGDFLCDVHAIIQSKGI